MNKNIFSIVIGFYLVTFSSIRAQTITSCSGDSIMLVLDQQHTGTITWNSSADSSIWIPIPSSNTDTFYVTVSAAQQYYNASVQDNITCPLYYSPAMKVVTGNWTAGLVATTINHTTLGTNAFYSSSKLALSWTAPPAYTIDHYEIEATENIKGTSEIYSISSGQTADTITGLKSATAYTITIKGCANASCTDYIRCNDNKAYATTSEEFWQLQGTGDTMTTLTKIVSDGNTLNYAFVYGNWAPPGLEGYTRYFYNPNAGPEKGTKPAISNSIAVTNVNSTVTSFTGLSGYGLRYNGWVTGTNSPEFIGQAQALPNNGKISMFFEAELDDNKTRIFQLDSKDGYTGLDYNSGSSTLCTNPSDFTSTGGCAFQMILGVESDIAPFYNPSITNIRQFKIGYPTMESWLWTGADSTFMTPTFDFNTTALCSDVYKFTTGWALFDSTNNKWNLQYRTANCPYFFDGMQAPSIVHRGGNKYKLYYNQNTKLKGQPHNPQTDTKPMKVIYAENLNGHIVFEDWESLSVSRNLNYLWPNGDLLTVSQESKLDDYHFFAPTGDNDFQVQYTNISAGIGTIPIVVAAILLNP